MLVGSRGNLSVRSATDSRPPALRPLAALVRSILRSWPSASARGMKSSYLTLLSELPLPQYWRPGPRRLRFQFVAKHGELTLADYLKPSPPKQGRSSPFISMERMPETSDPSDSR